MKDSLFQKYRFRSGLWIRKEKRRDRSEMLDKVTVSYKETRYFFQRAKQRLSLARALIHEPRILFLDEPTSNLDPEGTVYIRNLILRLSREAGITIYINSHDLDEVERICSRIVIMKHGNIMLQGVIADLLRQNNQTTWSCWKKYPFQLERTDCSFILCLNFKIEKSWLYRVELRFTLLL